MTEVLEAYVVKRCALLGLTHKELCRRAGVSRQTLHSLVRAGENLPTLQTTIAVAHALQVSPVGLLQLLCDQQARLGSGTRRSSRRRYTGDASAFVADVNLSSGSLVLRGQSFIKTWELQNVGTATWANRQLKCMDDDIVVQTRSGDNLRLAENLRPESRCVAVADTKPGETVRVSVHFTAPDAPGSVLSYWKLAHSDGSICFPKASGVWIKVQVTTIHAAE